MFHVTVQLKISWSLLFFSCSVVSDSLRPQGLQCRTPGFPVHHQLLELAQTHVHRVSGAIQPSAVLCHPLFLLPSIFPASGSFPVSWLFTSGGQSIGASASPSVLPCEYTGLISFGIDCLISLLSRELSRVFSSTTVQKHQFVGCHSAFFMVQISHLYMTSGKIIALTIWAFVSKAVSLLFNTFSRFVITFFPRNKHLGISYQYLLVNFYNLNFFSLGQCLWTNL